MKKLLLLIWVLILSSCNEATKKKVDSKEKPNIIFIISDDQAWGDYSFMGHPHIQTPNIDQLAKESATYTKGYVSSPICGPSLATIITGKYAFQHAQTGNDAGDSKREPSFWDESDNEKLRTKKGNNFLFSKKRSDQFDIIKSKFYKNKLLTVYLSSKGYRSFQSGKWWMG